MSECPTMPLGAVSLLAHGKINLTLAVTGRRDDGYHTLLGVMQSIELSNRLRISALEPEEQRVRLSCDDPTLPTDRRNTAYKAAEAFLREIESPFGLQIVLQKRVPYEAGLGSASADAAGVLAGANELFGQPLSTKRLLSLAANVGADVPFCLIGGSQRAEGIGDRLTPVPPLPHCFLLIAKPPEGVSTPEAYARFDLLESPVIPDQAAMEQGLLSGDLASIGTACGNVFEQCCPVDSVAALKAVMLSCGALGSAMSGSGTAVFGVFDQRDKVEQAKAALSTQFPESRFFLTVPSKCGILFE